jgi:hypothetical protein
MPPERPPVLHLFGGYPVEDFVSSFSEQLKATRAARPTREVKVVLDGEIAAERERLLEQVESAKKSTDGRLSKKSPNVELQERLSALNEAAQDALVTLRFTRLAGRDWAELTSRFPARLTVPIDLNYGYNYDMVCEFAARESGVRIVDGEEVPLVVEEKSKDNPNPTDEWADLFDALSGNEVGLIRDAIWKLNEHDPAVRLNTLVKGFGAAKRSVNN